MQAQATSRAAPADAFCHTARITLICGRQDTDAKGQVITQNESGGSRSPLGVAPGDQARGGPDPGSPADDRDKLYSTREVRLPGCHGDRRGGASRDITVRSPGGNLGARERIFRTARQHPEDLNWTVGPSEIVAAAAVVAVGLQADEAVMREIARWDLDVASLVIPDERSGAGRRCPGRVADRGRARRAPRNGQLHRPHRDRAPLGHMMQERLIRTAADPAPGDQLGSSPQAGPRMVVIKAEDTRQVPVDRSRTPCPAPVRQHDHVGRRSTQPGHEPGHVLHACLIPAHGGVPEELKPQLQADRVSAHPLHRLQRRHR